MSLTLTIGRGNNRQTFELPSGKEFRDMKKTNPIEAVKISGNIASLARRNYGEQA